MRLEHTCFMVLDLDKSVDFYVNKLGFEKVRTVDLSQVGQTAVYVSPRGDKTAVELLYSPSRKEPYDIGEGFSHLAIEVESVEATYEEWSKRGVKFRGGPLRMAHGSLIAFCEDPDGYLIELVEKPQ